MLPQFETWRAESAFRLQDRDGNWWEIQFIVEPMKYNKSFARGDVIPT